jgi:hypothetical protein
MKPDSPDNFTKQLILENTMLKSQVKKLRDIIKNGYEKSLEEPKQKSTNDLPLKSFLKLLVDHVDLH